MYNHSLINLSISVEKNNSTVYSAVVPYPLLSLVRHQANETFTVVNGLDTFTSYGDAPHFYIQKVYEELTNQQAFDAVAQQENAEHEAFLRQQSVEEFTRAQNALEQLAQETEALYHQSVEAQRLLEEERLSHLDAEAMRLDMLRASTISQVAGDPMTSVSALQSEVGNNLDVQRQIAISLRTRPDVALSIIASDLLLWSTSFEIMDVLAEMAVDHEDIRTALIETLPVDSALRHSLLPSN